MLNSLNIMLEPSDTSAILKLIEWSNYSENKEFFRHFPPRLEWIGNAEILQQIQVNSLVVKNISDIIGLIYISNVNLQARSMEVSLIVVSADRKDIVDEVINQLKQYIFVDKNFNRVSVKILESRCKLKERLESNGFKTEGLLIKSAYTGSQFQNEWLLGLTKE